MKLHRLAFAAIALTVAAPALADEGLPAAGLMQAAATLTPNRYLWADQGGEGPVSVLVSIADQKAFVYRGRRLVAVTTVSTGKEGKETPTGIFSILQKKQMHRSNLYNDAPMPFMQRLTWDGIAIHAGRNPGAPASHGCIRVPTEFAKRLFEATEMGATVEVIDGPVFEDTPAPRSEAEITAEANRRASTSLDSFLASRD